MKNARKFNHAKHSTLTEEEKHKLKTLINEICDAHTNDEWWKVDCAIKSTVNRYLLHREADEGLAELDEEDEEDEY